MIISACSLLSGYPTNLPYLKIDITAKRLPNKNIQGNP
ncbi:hypothetical protein COO91_08663 [Nostoc flagelliforme CCNUN1]|uniref:Uncharacterized protein n=1 Tax=Nostoc flagelliforme CCNUN1 TaxID=2038116 RepID=A0A2K8T4K8_9NOSO|nr:hypothetical protein COO91_08663 [Nostoc flagelliforme CCNUN1]